MKTCKHKGCSNKHASLGYCTKHYNQFKKHGKTFSVTCFDFNEIVDCGDHYELILLDRNMEENGRAKIDKQDLKKVKVIGRWGLDSEGYVCNGYTKTMMHRLLMNAKGDEEVDHKETGIKFRSDNRKRNLRLATKQENQFNRSKQKNNTSGYKGVSWHKRTEKWVAKIGVNGSKVHLGVFNTPLEASEAYNAAAKKLHKKFAHSTL